MAAEKQGFCLNSRRWVFLIDINGLPKSCPYRGHEGRNFCYGEAGCAYHEMRPLSKYAQRKIKAIAEMH